MRGRPMPRSATWGTVIVRARREPPPGRPGPCRTPIGSWAPSRLGSPAPTTASATTTSRCPSTSSPPASTAGGPRWPPSRPSSVSPPASTARRPTTCCTVRSQPDRQKLPNQAYVRYSTTRFCPQPSPDRAAPDGTLPAHAGPHGRGIPQKPDAADFASLLRLSGERRKPEAGREDDEPDQPHGHLGEDGWGGELK